MADDPRSRKVAEHAVPQSVIDAFEGRYSSYLSMERDDHEWRNTWRYKHEHIQSMWEGWRDGWIALASRSSAIVEELMAVGAETRKTLIETAEGLEMSATAEQFVFDGLQPMVDRFHAGDHAPEVMRSLRVYNDSRHNKDWWRKQAAAIRAALNAALTVEPEAPYVPQVIHFDGEGDPHWEFVERDCLTITGEVFAANVEQLFDADRKLIGFRIFDPARVEPEAGEVK